MLTPAFVWAQSFSAGKPLQYEIQWVGLETWNLKPETVIDYAEDI